MTPMILLLGGTSDTPPIARRLMESGYRVLVSQATDVPLETACHPNLESRAGRLDEHSLCELVERRGIRAIVDATHPYAVQIRVLARRVADDKGIPYFCFLRPAAIDPSLPGVEMAPDHPAAAIAAFGRGRPVLLTTGTRNLGPYVERARAAQLPLVVRALNTPHRWRPVCGPVFRGSTCFWLGDPFPSQTIAGTSARSALACW